MALTVEINRSGFQDISDYVVSLSSVPYIRRNRDWTPISEDINISISYSNPYNIIKLDTIRIKNDSTVLFYGVIQAIVESADTRTYNCKVDSELLGLNYLVEYGELHDVIADTADEFLYQAASLSGVPTVQVFWLMQKIFEKDNMTLDVSAVEDLVAFTYDFITGETLDVEYKRITLDENMVYCINQNIAAFHSTIDGTGSNYNGSKITAWNLIQKICSAFKVSLIITGTSAYKLVFIESVYAIDDNDKYSYAREDIEAKYQNVSISYYGLERRFYLTTDADPVELKQFDGYGSLNTIEWYNNFEFYFHFRFEGAWFPGGEVPLEFVVGDSTTLNPIQAKVEKLLLSYTKETIVTSINTTVKSVVQNILNLKEQTSKIIQEI